jgi:hypothetical protein
MPGFFVGALRSTQPQQLCNRHSTDAAIPLTMMLGFRLCVMTTFRSPPIARLAPRRLERSPELRRTWLFGAGADPAMHDSMTACGADVLILVQPEHVRPVRDALIPTQFEIAHAKKVVADFEAARKRGEDRALVDGLWIDAPTYLNARRLVRSQ